MRGGGNQRREIADEADVVLRDTGTGAGKMRNAGVFPFRRNPIRRILEKYTVRVVAVDLWKKIVLRIIIQLGPTFVVRSFCYCNCEPSQHS